MFVSRISALPCLRQVGWTAAQKNLRLDRNFTSSSVTYANTLAAPGSNSQKSGHGNNTLKLVAMGAGLGAVFGTLFSVYENYKTKNANSEYKKLANQVLDELPKNVKITKRFVNDQDKSGLELVLFQYQTCPFCCKVRAFLDFMGVSYSVVEVDAVLRQDLKWSRNKKVPTLLARQRDGRWVQISDSSAIISLLATYLYENGSLDVAELASYYQTISFVNDSNKRREDIMNKYFLMYQNHTPKNISKDAQELERNWRAWVDTHLVHLISPNCYRTLGEAFETFQWFSKAGEWDVHFPAWERHLMVNVGAVAMWVIAKVLKKRHGLEDDVRTPIYTALDKWIDDIERRGGEFHGGKEPNLADVSVFGVLSSMEGCQAFKDCLNNTNIGAWFNRMKAIILKNRGHLVKERIEGGSLHA